jgi:hypothetical protein
VVVLGESYSGVWPAVRTLAFIGNETRKNVSLPLGVAWSVCMVGRYGLVDPVKSELKPPGTHLLTLKCDEQLSTFACKLNLRRYNVDCQASVVLVLMLTLLRKTFQAEPYTRPLFSST